MLRDVVTLAIGLAWPVMILVVVSLTHPTGLVRRGPVYSFQVRMVSGCGRGHPQLFSGIAVKLLPNVTRTPELLL